MNTTYESDNLKDSMRILNSPLFEDLNQNITRALAESNTDVELFDCTKKVCSTERVNCNADNTVCSCKLEYSTSVDGHPCNYEKKRQLVAFLLELFVGFGGGHFYTERYLMASLKLVTFLFGIYIICLFPFTAKCMGDSCNSDCGVILTSCFYYLYSLGLASWFIIDLVWFGKNKYFDGNDQALIPW